MKEPFAYRKQLLAIHGGARKLHRLVHSRLLSSEMMTVMNVVLIEIKIKREHRDDARYLKKANEAANAARVRRWFETNFASRELRGLRLYRAFARRHQPARRLTVDVSRFASRDRLRFAHALLFYFLAKLQDITIVIVYRKFTHAPGKCFDVVAKPCFVPDARTHRLDVVGRVIE
jgi:hypothetical protein